MLFLDTEFNGHGGKLISMALVDNDGRFFYEAVEMNDHVHPWVAANVIPKLEREPLPMGVFKRRLHDFLTSYQGDTIVADWSSDFVHFFSALAGDTYENSLNYGCRAVLLVDVNPTPENPHNALSDAIALAKWYGEYRAA